MVIGEHVADVVGVTSGECFLVVVVVILQAVW